jgi:hypothetical protein
MAIVMMLSFSDFVDQFDKMGRKDQYSINALRELYDYYNDDDFLAVGDNFYELDVVGICCDWTEYNKQEFLKYFDISLEDYCIESIEDFGFLKAEKILDNLGHQFLFVDSDTILIRQ